MRTTRLFALIAPGLLTACAAHSGPIPTTAPDATATNDAPSVLTTSLDKTALVQPDTSLSGEALVSAADPRAAEAGAAILRAGGSATDAAIATMVALTVVEPQSSGIGGGGFFLHSDAAGNVTTIDGRERAPAAAGPDWFLGEDGEPLGYRDAVLTGLSIGVPGNLRLAEKAHAEYGRLAWARLFEPAIALAEQGFTLTPRGHEYLSRFKDRAFRDPAIRSVFYDPAGEPLTVGTRIANPALAATLRAVAEKGPDALHTGDTAAALAAAIAADTPREQGMTAADVEGYTATPRPPVCGSYRGYRICGMGPPSSGATTVFAILKQLERFDLASLGPDNPNFWHLFAESQRLAYADRERYLADGDFVDVPVEWLTDPAYLAGRSALISASSRMDEAVAGTAPGLAIAPPDGREAVERGTSHFVVRDAAGNTVSYTSTIEGPFGSGLTFGGFYLNNELTDFSFAPEEGGRAIANRVQGGKRPRSSMSPTLVFDPQGRLFMAVGAAGGGTIIVQTARAIIGAVDFGLDARAALALPMLYSPGDTIAIEEGTRLEAIVPALEALGHSVEARSLPLKANAILCRDQGRACTGAADPRSEGAVALP